MEVRSITSDLENSSNVIRTYTAEDIAKREEGTNRTNPAKF